MMGTLQHSTICSKDGTVNTATSYDGEAFWIQKRVLKWANYQKLILSNSILI